MNSLLIALVKIVIKTLITLINIFYLIPFKIFFFKINIREAINSLYINFYSVFI